jgi:phosphoribosylformylglycinamidine cyclo-ligase
MRKIGKVPEEDYRRTFNLGVGMILVVPKRKAAEAQKQLSKRKENAFVIGAIVESKSKRRVLYK